MRTHDAVARRGQSPQASEELGATVYDVVRDLRRDVGAVRLPLATDDVAEQEASRVRLLAQLDEHLLPRLQEMSSPAVVVVAGSTGAGKSTLYNSLLGDEVSEAGVLRPTTREPVLAYNPLDVDVLADGPVVRMSRVVEHDGVPRGTALLDAPDLDSLLAQNRETAGLLLEAADLWLFVTTAARYGDALPWQALGRAMERGASVAMILNRVPRENLATIRGDLLQRLREHGMDGVPLFVVPDAGPHEGLLDRSDVAPIARWLTMLAGPDRSRAVIVRTLKGALGALPAWVESTADAVDAQAAAADVARARVAAVLRDVEADARHAVTSGAVADGSVAARWSQVTGDQRVDRVTIRGGLARGSRRRGRAREEALAPFCDEVRSAAARTLVGAGTAAEDALVDALTTPGTPAAVAALAPERGDPERETAREEAARREVSEWVSVAERAVESIQGVPEPGTRSSSRTARGDAALKAYGPRGLTALLLSAAAGQPDTTRLVHALLGEAGDTVVQELTEDLAARAGAMATRAADDLHAALDDPAVAPDAATGLRVRLAELRRFM